MPKLSIAIPNYNMAQYLPEVLESVFFQTYRNFEIIIVDDGSTDDSIAVIQDFQKRYPSYIRLVHHTHNLGSIAAVNHGVQAAQGTYIFILAADDKLVDNNFFLEAVTLLEQYPDYPMCTSDHATFQDGSSEIKSWAVIPHLRTFTPLSAESFFKILSSRQNKDGLYLLGTVFRKEAFWRYGCFNSKFRTLSDWYIIHLLALSEGCLYLPKVCIAWRNRGHANLHHHASPDEPTNFLWHLTKSPKQRRLFCRSLLLIRTVNPSLLYLSKHPKLWVFLIYYLRHKIQRTATRLYKSVEKRVRYIMNLSHYSKTADFE